MGPRLRRWVLAAVVVCVACGAVASALLIAGANASEQKRKDIRRLMVLTGAADLSTQIMDQLMSSLKRSTPSVPDPFWDEFRAGIKIDELVEFCIPICEKHLSHEDIKNSSSPTSRPPARG